MTSYKKLALSTILMTMISIGTSAETKTLQFNVEFSSDTFTLCSEEYGRTVITTNLPSVCHEDRYGIPWLPVKYALPGGFSVESYDIELQTHLYKADVDVVSYDTFWDKASQHTTNCFLNNDFHFPDSNIIITSTSVWSDLSVVNLLVCPFVYEEKDKDLYFVDSITINMDISDELSNISDLESGRCPDFIRNGLGLDSGSLSPTYIKSSSTTDQERIDYIIITSEILKESFEPLIKWKKKKGIYCKILTTDEIYSNYSDKTDQLKIKRALYDLYSNNGLQYVLLGGDDKVVPVQGCYGIVYDKGEGKNIVDRSIPTDLFYACFSGSFDWNSSGDGVIGEVKDGINLAQSICITRLPIRQSYDVSAFVDKVIAYETSGSYNNKMLMAGATLITTSADNDNISDAEAEGEMIYEGYISPHWNGEIFKFFDTGSDFSDGDGADYDFNAVNLMTRIAEGYSFIDVNTHGEQTVWQMEDESEYGSWNGEEQKNEGFTIITTSACYTNAFDSSEKGGEFDPCLSESLIRNPDSGIIAYVGCSRQGWTNGYVTSDITPSGQYTASFYGNLFSKRHHGNNFGKVVAAAKDDLISFCNSDGPFRWILFGLNPIGDPEMPIFTEQPKEFANAKLIPRMNGRYTVEAGVDSCRMCLMSSKDFGDTYYHVDKDISNMDIASLGKDCDVTITKPGYVPLTYDIIHLYNGIENIDRIVSADVVEVGCLENFDMTHGYVVNQGKTTIKAKTVVLGPGTEVKKGASLVVSPFIIDNK